MASHDSRLEPTPATEVDAAARGVATAAGAAEDTDSTAAAGAAAAGASLLVTTTASEGVEATVREDGTSVVDESTAVPLLPAEGVTTGESLPPRRGLAAAEDAPLRGAELLSAELESLEAPPRLPRRAGEDFVEDVDAELEAWSLEAPAEPVVSAYAIGIAEIAEPMPNATANAPTRPMYLETLGVRASDAFTEGRLYSMAWMTESEKRRPLPGVPEKRRPLPAG